MKRIAIHSRCEEMAARWAWIIAEELLKLEIFNVQILPVVFKETGSNGLKYDEIVYDELKENSINGGK